MRSARTASFGRAITKASLVVGLFVLGLLIAWSAGLLAGWPALPLASKRGTEGTFPVAEGRAVAAITNAFGGMKYSEMMLSEAVGQDRLARGWHPTNGFVLQPTLEPTTWIPTKGLLGARRLPYFPFFHITASVVGANQTRINVRTIKAFVGDGISLDPHAGSVGTARISPVRQEEERLLAAISEEISRSNDRN